MHRVQLPRSREVTVSGKTISVVGAETQVGFGVAGERVALRAFREDDLPFLVRLCTDPEALGEFEWPGFVDVRARRRRWEKDGYIGEESSALAVVLPDGPVAGIASWRAHNRGGSPGACYELRVRQYGRAADEQATLPQDRMAMVRATYRCGGS